MNNDESHNHNDIGSFILNVGGETLLTDPGAGLYSKDYFSNKRYENIFANSFGHSVPVIANKLQGTGKHFSGEILLFDTSKDSKKVRVEFSQAYDIETLISLTRELSISNNSQIVLEDTYTFSKSAPNVEEAFITWKDVSLEGNSAIITGDKYFAKITISEPPMGLVPCLERLDKDSNENKKLQILNRISFKAEAPEKMKVKFKFNVEIGRL